jgi:hypothetical protein
LKEVNGPAHAVSYDPAGGGRVGLLQQAARSGQARDDYDDFCEPRKRGDEVQEKSSRGTGREPHSPSQSAPDRLGAEHDRVRAIEHSR